MKCELVFNWKLVEVWNIWLINAYSSALLRQVIASIEAVLVEAPKKIARRNS